ncbi:hypothetical protein HK097_011165, partial [Rhizophlyctis rosea]
MTTSTDIVSYFAAGNEVLYSGAEGATTKEYYEALCKNKPFEVRYTGPERGKAMFALKDIAKGETILEEYGWVGMQAVVNKVDFSLFACCYIHMSFASQLEHLLGRRLSDTERAEVEEAAGLTKVEAGGRVRREVPCEVTAACGEVYCSEECREKAWQLSHAVMCPAARPEAKAAFDAFYDHAEDTNEIFLMAAKTYARILIDVRERGKSLKAALTPVRMFVKDYWWNVMEVEEGESKEEFEQAIRQVLQDSIELLKAAIPFPEIEPLYNVEFYGLLIGLFERNNLSIEVPHPILGCFERLPPWLQNHVVEAIRKALDAVGTSCACGHDHTHDDPTSDHDHSTHHHHTHTDACTHDHDTDRKSIQSSIHSIPPAPSSHLLPNVVPHARGGASSDAGSDVRSTLSATRTFHSSVTGHQTMGGDDPLTLLDALHCEGTALHPLQATINHDCFPNARVVAKDVPTPHLLPDTASGVTGGGGGKGKSVVRDLLPGE